MPTYGPYHRVRSTTQTDELAYKIQESGELWGKAPRWSGTPQPQAYDGPLPDGEIGIEFTTDVAPRPGSAPKKVRWWPDDPGVIRLRDEIHAMIPVTVTRNTHPRPRK